LVSVLLVFLSAAGAFQDPHAAILAPAVPPASAVREVAEDIHGLEIVDPYRWLEDQKSPETRAWIDAQSAYTNSILAKLPQRERLKQRFSSLLNVDSLGTPDVLNGHYFFDRRLAGQDQYMLCIRRGLQGKEEVLIDPLPMSAEHRISAEFRS